MRMLTVIILTLFVIAWLGMARASFVSPQTILNVLKK